MVGAKESPNENKVVSESGSMDSLDSKNQDSL